MASVIWPGAGPGSDQCTAAGPARRVEVATGEVIVDEELLLIGVVERPESDEDGAMGGVTRGGLRSLAHRTRRRPEIVDTGFDSCEASTGGAEDSGRTGHGQTAANLAAASAIAMGEKLECWEGRRRLELYG
jgi:hypothetical protein